MKWATPRPPRKHVSAVATPTAASPFAGLFTRVKPLDQNELVSTMEVIAQAEQQAVAQATGTQAGAGAQQLAATNPAAAAQQQLATQQQAAVQQQQLAAQQQAAQQAAVQQQAPQQQAAQAAGQVQQVAQTGQSTTAGAVAIPASKIAPRTAHDYWYKHMAQFPGKYLPDSSGMRPNCGPASVTMALRMIGLDIPGFKGQNSEAVLDKARILATGSNNYTVGTTDGELENLITKSGGKWSESTNFSEVTNWVKQGIPVVLSGNPAHGWNQNPQFPNDKVQHFNGGHWVTVSGYDAAQGKYIVNDPLSQIGPIYVTEQELRGYNKAHGNLGIAVFRQ